MANPRAFASAPPSAIFIDKFSVSGIEMMILDSPLQENPYWAGSLLTRSRQWRNVLIFIVEGWPPLETLRRRVDLFERP
jgi:hypothetical protein